MELTEIKELVNKPNDLIEKVKSFYVDLRSEDALKELEPEKHDVMNSAIRKNKPIKKPSPYGLLDANGKPLMIDDTEYVNRISLALQKLIVSRAATFLTGTPVEFEATTETDQEEILLEMLKKTWQDNKLDYKTRPIAKAMMAEKECVELWHTEEAADGYWGDLGTDKTKLKMRFTILKPSDGNVFYPVFNNYGDMTAFGRGYKIRVDGKEKECLDIYTTDAIYKFVNAEIGWEKVYDEKGVWPQPHIFGKIPLIYYCQKRTEWADVQKLIDRLEKLLSNFADTNDYFSGPKMIVKGEVKGFATKGEQGQIYELEGENAEMKYLSWDQAPEAIKLEIETLFDMIYTITQTANITFKEMKGIGPLAGIAIKLMFMDAHSKAKDKQDDMFGECIQRRINLIKAGMAKINVTLASAVNMSITPKFGLFMPDNEIEQLDIKQKEVDILMTANGNKAILAHQFSVEQGPFDLDDREANWEALEKEAKEAKENKVTNDLFQDDEAA